MTANQYKLSDLIEIQHGFAFKGEHFSDDGKFPTLVTPGNFSIGGGFQDTKPKTYSGEFPSSYILNPGELVLTMTDLSKAGDTLGYAAIVPSGKTYLHNQRIGRVILKRPDLITIEYLHWVLRTKPYRDFILGSATGTTVRHTSPGRVLEYELFLPDLDTQTQVASILDSLDGKIDLNKQLANDLDELAQIIFNSWVMTPGPSEEFSINTQGGGRDKAKPAFPLKVGINREKWVISSLDEIADFLNGLAMQKFPAISSETALPVIKIAQLRAGSTVGANLCDASIDRRYVIQDGDILFSWSGTLEVEQWAGGPGGLNQHLFKVTGKTVPGWFAYLATKHFLPQFRQIANDKATTMGHIQRSHLSNTKLAIPPLSEMKSLGEVFGPLLEEKLNLQVEAVQLRTLRDSLLPKLINNRFDTNRKLLEV
jgi:type I restriction enzyme S subunit